MKREIQNASVYLKMKDGSFFTARGSFEEIRDLLNKFRPTKRAVDLATPSANVKSSHKKSSGKRKGSA